MLVKEVEKLPDINIEFVEGFECLMGRQVDGDVSKRDVFSQTVCTFFLIMRIVKNCRMEGALGLGFFSNSFFILIENNIVLA